MENMADLSIDQSRLPGVKEVCRDFAVLEDHTLAHNLQEQEIEHHLATNVHRTRLVQHDLMVAKKLQEEEDVRARMEMQKKKKDLERHDSKVAHVIQEELVIEAEQRRRQEEKDEGIARKLQEKELKEEKRRKKRPDFMIHDPCEDSHNSTNEDALRVRRPQHNSEHEGDRHHRNRSQEKSTKPRNERKGSQSQFFVDNCDQVSEHSRRSPQPTCSHWKEERDRPRHKQGHERERFRKERPERPPPPKFSKDSGKSVDHRDRENYTDTYSDLVRPRSRSYDDFAKGGSQKDRFYNDDDDDNDEGINTRDHRQTEVSGDMRVEPRLTVPSPSREDMDRDRRHHDHHRETGVKSRGVREVTHGITQLTLREQEIRDAEIARRLQEEELKAGHVDKRAAQVAQDEEIARFLMAEENPEYKKGKERDKMSGEKRRPDKEKKYEVSEPASPRSREDCEPSRSRSEKPSRFLLQTVDDLASLPKQ